MKKRTKQKTVKKKSRAELYETDADRKNERALISAFKRCTGRTELFGYKLPIEYELDFFLLDRDKTKHKWEHCTVRAFAECKMRKYKAGAFDTYMISLHKWQKMLDLRDRTRKNVFLIVGFVDAAYYLVVDEHVMGRLAAGGRGDRGDLQDFEPCVYVKMDFFTKFATRSAKKTTRGVIHEFKSI